jgi:hypothetical protein
MSQNNALHLTAESPVVTVPTVSVPFCTRCVCTLRMNLRICNDYFPTQQRQIDLYNAGDVRCHRVLTRNLTEFKSLWFIRITNTIHFMRVCCPRTRNAAYSVPGTNVTLLQQIQCFCNSLLQRTEDDGYGRGKVAFQKKKITWLPLLASLHVPLFPFH